VLVEIRVDIAQVERELLPRAVTMRREPSSTTANRPIVSTPKNTKCGFVLEC